MTTRFLRPLAMLTSAAFVLAGCRLGLHHGLTHTTQQASVRSAPASTPTTEAQAPPASSQGSGPGASKPPLLGIIDMGVQNSYQEDQPFPTINMSPLDGYAGAFAGVVVNESWQQLEPHPGVYDWTDLDNSLAAVSAWNAQHPSTPVGVKLRVFAGYSAPSWVTSQSGTVTEDVHGITVQIGRWWTPSFESAWRSFQLALGAAFDSNSLIRQVSVSSCSSSTGEPFVVSGALVSQRNLQAAGWTPALQYTCLQQALGDYANWKTTPVTFAMNVLPGAIGSQGRNVNAMDTIATACAQSKTSGGPTCIIGNNDLAPDISSTSASGPLVQEIQALYSEGVNPTVYFQTSGAPLTCSTIAMGLQYHAQSIEVWSPNGRGKGFTVIPPGTLASWNNALKSGATSLAC